MKVDLSWFDTRRLFFDVRLNDGSWLRWVSASAIPHRIVLKK